MSKNIQEKLQEAMENLAAKKETSEHRDKMEEECLELALEVVQARKKGNLNTQEIMKEMSDVLNTIDIFLISVGIDKESLNEYRLKQVEKHL